MGIKLSICVLSILSLFHSPVLGTPCVVFDTWFNLYAFGIQGTHSWKVGQLNALGGGTAANLTTISAENRPKFDGPNTQCYLAQYFNAIYVINGDAANPSDIHVYDATQDKWSVQKADVSSGVNPNKLTAILDHDTNVFFALSDDVLYALRMGETKVAGDNALKWDIAGRPNFKTDGYKPMMAVAKNHIHFLNVPGNNPGQDNIFVVHFAYFQPEIQSYQPREGGAPFPATAGRVFSIFAPTESDEEQRYIAFIPDNGSQTYVLDVHSNTTTTLPPPSPADAESLYAASDSALVQLTPQGQLYYLPFDYAQMATAGTKWVAVTSPQLGAPSSPHPSKALAPTSAMALSKASSSAKPSAGQRCSSAPVIATTFFLSAILALYNVIS